ncbi:MAG: DUF72 domain-containing protein [Acidimicrobiales bacterium]
MPPSGSSSSSGRGRAHVGCSGWVYKDWRGIVYPEDMPQRRWFEHYSSRFDTVEINNTFYRLPPATTVEKWAAQAPPGFVYSLKLGAFCSHRMKLRDAASWLPNHLDRAERLGNALGPTLVQLPPGWRRDAGRLEEFLAVAPSHLRWAVELREPSWLHEEVYDVLRRHNAALCVHDILPDHPWLRTADWTYARFHGPDAANRKYWGRYGEEGLSPAADRLAAWQGEGCDVYAYFNNDHEGNAVLDATWLRDRLG